MHVPQEQNRLLNKLANWEVGILSLSIDSSLPEHKLANWRVE